MIVLSVAFFATDAYADGAKGKIIGFVIDSKTNEPMQFVNVSIKGQNAAGSLPLGTVTDKEGGFYLGDVPYGSYTLTVSYIGYTSVNKDITLSSSENMIDLHRIMLAENALMMDEVKVVGMKSQMKIDIDKKVFEIDQNIASTGGSASDILSNIPSVEVDNEGGISLHGNSSVTVWVNGKASGLSAENRAQILEQLPAESIESIEVITNPSAKYSPEGTAGIINIVLKKNRKAGYYGSLQAGADSRGGYSGSANYNYSSSKLDAYASLSYRNRQRQGGGFTDRLNINDSDTTYLNQVSSTEGYGNHVFTRLGLNYHITPQDHISVGGFTMFGNGKNNSSVDYLSNIPNSFTSRSRLTSSDQDMFGGNAEIGYKHEFGKDHYIDFTTSFNKWGMDGNSVYRQTSLLYDGTESSSYQKQDQDINNKNWEIQLDYLKKVNENTKIEAGYKGTLSRENSPVETFSGNNEADAVPQTELFNRFIYDLDVHALYTTYSGRINKLGYQLGLRGEYSNLTTRSPGYNQEEADVTPFTNEYFSLFPSAFLSYSLPNDNELQVSYTRRISRPWGGQLNSFVNITDSTNLSFGNPNLLPQFSNAFEVNYIKNWDKHVLSFSGYYRDTYDVIQRISYLEENVMKTTYENITKEMSAGTELVLKNELFKILDLTTTLDLYYYKLDGFSYLPLGSSTPVAASGSDNFSWNARMIANFKLPKAVSLQLTGNYDAREVIAQGYRKASYTMDAGLRKSFDKISVSINGRDLLDSRKNRSVTSGTGFSQKSENWRGGRQVGLTVTYSFGNMKPRKSNNERQSQPDTTGGYGIENEL